MIVVCGVHYFLYVTLQSQREDPDAIYGTVDDDVYATVGDTGQSYYSMVCFCGMRSYCTIGNNYVNDST